MKSVNIGDLRNGLSAYLQFVRNGEEVVICDRNVPIARILPFRKEENWDRDAALVASGVLKKGERKMDWEKFFELRGEGSVSRDVAVQAAIESRGDR